jgi:hypothetical protein
MTLWGIYVHTHRPLATATTTLWTNGPSPRVLATGLKGRGREELELSLRLYDKEVAIKPPPHSSHTHAHTHIHARARTPLLFQLEKLKKKRRDAEEEAEIAESLAPPPEMDPAPLLAEISRCVCVLVLCVLEAAVGGE